MLQTEEGQAELSVVVPLYNEEESLPLLVVRLLEALRPLGRSFELVLVDDGSSDGTAEVLRELAATTPELVAVLLRRNYGQTAAMQAGLQMATGDVIVTMDGDLQNAPEDIPALAAHFIGIHSFICLFSKYSFYSFLYFRHPGLPANQNDLIYIFCF